MTVLYNKVCPHQHVLVCDCTSDLFSASVSVLDQFSHSCQHSSWFCLASTSTEREVPKCVYILFINSLFFKNVSFCLFFS